eukprot:TRINITY_DN3005_c0_g1_i3.p1 TRINITY_DN3005_c0_g1~~TRINITY_DN3005_c0_g1_i3.p1  ORF type:complete len:207 (-),score=24.93 TRINITY_DN3005_c0_g1_i3:8-628(-)
MAMQAIKLLTLGEGAVGKTCLLISYTTGAFPGEYIPTVFDNYSANVMYKEKAINLGLWDQSPSRGGEPNRLRPLSYPQTDIFVLIFSISSPNSIAYLRETILPEITQHCPKAKRMLLGTKLDLREDKDVIQRLAERGQSPVTYEEGLKLSIELGCTAYRECSALTQVGVKDVFNTAIGLVLDSPKEKKKKGGFKSFWKKSVGSLFK